jgi:hypothetical protein
VSKLNLIYSPEHAECPYINTPRAHSMVNASPQLVAEHHPSDPAVWVDVAELYHLAASTSEPIGVGDEAGPAESDRAARFGILGR